MSHAGILLVAHGSKDPNWKLPFEAIREETRRQFRGPVSLAYLESINPDFVAAIDELAAQDVERIRIVPLFLAAGSHIRIDLPRLIGIAKSRHGTIEFELTSTAGESAMVQQAIASFAIGR